MMMMMMILFKIRDLNVMIFLTNLKLCRKKSQKCFSRQQVTSICEDAGNASVMLKMRLQLAKNTLAVNYAVSMYKERCVMCPVLQTQNNRR